MMTARRHSTSLTRIHIGVPYPRYGQQRVWGAAGTWSYFKCLPLACMLTNLDRGWRPQRNNLAHPQLPKKRCPFLRTNG